MTPTDEEAKVIREFLGVDLDALHARILAMVDAYEAGELTDAGDRPPESHLRDRRARREVAMPAPEERKPVEPPRARPVSPFSPELIDAMHYIVGTIPRVRVEEKKSQAARTQRRDPRGRR